MADHIETLVVDDEQSVRFFVGETLKKSGCVVDMAADGEEALEKLRDNRYELVMLDLKLGGRVDGLRVLNAIRWRWPHTAVVILTAHGSLGSAMAAIREGVDGYVLKPVEPDELRKIVQEALDRRRELTQQQAQPESHTLTGGPFVVNTDKHLATYKGEPLDLTPQEFKLLSFMLENSHRVIGPKELVSEVRDYDCDSLYEARQIIKWYIHRLRQKIEPDPSTPRYVINVRGVGYRFGD
jgi:DNA-binding response OmpR family regulator